MTHECYESWEELRDELLKLSDFYSEYSSNGVASGFYNYGGYAKIAKKGADYAVLFFNVYR